MNAQTALTRDLLKASVELLADAPDKRASVAISAYHSIENRAIAIVMGRPFSKHCRRDGETYYHLVTDASSMTATLTWSRRGVADRCRFPSFLLDLTDGALNDWRDAQGGMLAAVVPGQNA